MGNRGREGGVDVLDQRIAKQQQATLCSIQQWLRIVRFVHEQVSRTARELSKDHSLSPSCAWHNLLFQSSSELVSKL